MTQDRVMENVNLGLNYLTIDDLIRRAMENEGVDASLLERGDKSIRVNWGKGVFQGKVVIYRPDFNSPIKQDEEGQYYVNGLDRIEASMRTINELVGYGAKVVVVAHQGTAGEADCISLEPHKRVLEDLLGGEVIFKRGFWYGEETVRIIREEMRGGDIFLLENIRKLSDEVRRIKDPNEFASTPDSYMIVLGGLADFYVNDAFSTSHRWQGSIVGFPNTLNIAGRLTEKEIAENRELSADISSPYTMLFGGLKVSGYLDFIENSLDNGLVDNILATGALGIMGVLGIRGRRAKNYFGRRTVQFLEEKGIYSELNTVTGLARRYTEGFVLPVDFKVELDGEVYDMTPEEIQSHPDKDRMNLYGIGPVTVARFKEILERSNTIYIKGSPTKDDDSRFLQESQELIDSIVQLKRKGATTIVSGGDTNNLVTKLGYSPQTDFTFSTLAGGAATEYHSGILLPGLLMLNTSYNAFYGKDLYDGLNDHPLEFGLVAPGIPGTLALR